MMGLAVSFMLNSFQRHINLFKREGRMLPVFLSRNKVVVSTATQGHLALSSFGNPHTIHSEI